MLYSGDQPPVTRAESCFIDCDWALTTSLTHGGFQTLLLLFIQPSGDLCGCPVSGIEHGSQVSIWSPDHGPFRFIESTVRQVQIVQTAKPELRKGCLP